MKTYFEFEDVLLWFFLIFFCHFLFAIASDELYKLVTSSRQIKNSELGLVSRMCESNNWASSNDLFYRTDYCQEIVGWNSNGIKVKKGFDAKSIKTEADWIYWRR